ncbi:type II toxin-antitoxin system VapC family toxin [Kribbella hippodromi]|uniref:Ribonuclease VapC n=1 Tax=Kribbella hippodromi TaxID=434347 RepID=A0ABP4MPE4_9ACTN
MIYLDSAAIVKLVHAESESQALRKWLDERAEVPWVSSVLAEVETFRALARHAPSAIKRLPRVLDLIDLTELDAAGRIVAQAVQPAEVRSLDAIHLAAAKRAGPLVSFVTYDKRLADAARTAGLPVDAPS